MSPGHTKSRKDSPHKAHSLARRYRHSRVVLFKWHRRIGVSAAILTLILCVTGLLLNHTESLSLDKHYITQSLLLKIYKVERPPSSSFAIGEKRFSHMGGQHLFLDTKVIALCSQAFTGAVMMDSLTYLACNDELIVLTPDMEELERIGSNYQLPKPVLALGQCEGSLCMRTDQQIFRVDTEQLIWQVLSPTASVQWSEQSSLPSTLEKQLLEEFPSSQITLERLLVDLHSGRLFGGFGVLLMDLCAIALIALVGSGFWLWWRRPVARKK